MCGKNLYLWLKYKVLIALEFKINYVIKYAKRIVVHSCVTHSSFRFVLASGNKWIFNWYILSLRVQFKPRVIASLMCDWKINAYFSLDNQFICKKGQSWLRAQQHCCLFSERDARWKPSLSTFVVNWAREHQVVDTFQITMRETLNLFQILFFARKIYSNDSLM